MSLRIAGPEELKRMTPRELAAVAEALREEIIRTVARNGGHLGPNLGVVELAIALHVVLESPRDKIIWDTGHQSYPHKLLTGRADRFHTLRTYGGISGFCKRSESAHDVWEAGHAGTAVSGALGYAVARDLRGEDFRVVAVVGDGALTSGLSLEALNNAGQIKSQLTVVLNDNSMSIAPNVGALSNYLSRLRSEPAYIRAKEDLSRMLEKIPRVGQQMARAAERLKDGIKQLIIPGMLFEELGFTYLGPIDGHNTQLLIEVLGHATRLKRPVLVHVVTRKGKGYRPAEDRPREFHGVGPFTISEDAVVKGEEGADGGLGTLSGIFGAALMELARDRPEVVAITAAMPDGTGLSGFAAAFPQRFFDVGIAESHAVTFAAGLASAGMRPVVAIYSSFLQRAYDQILHDVCLQRLPVVFAIDRAGIVGPDGETHHGVYDLAYLRHIPGLTIMVPRDEAMLRDMLATALGWCGPVAIRYPRANCRGQVLPLMVQSIPQGKGELLREGSDVAIIAIGPMVHTAMEAAECLAGQGISAAVADARFVKPLDGQLIENLARRTGLVVTLEEHTIVGGFGSAVLEFLSTQGLCGARVQLLGVPDRFVTHGKREELLAVLGLDARGVARSVAAAVESARSSPRQRHRLARG